MVNAGGMSGEQWNPEWELDIRIGAVATAWVTSFILDSELPIGAGCRVLGREAHRATFTREKWDVSGS